MFYFANPCGPAVTAAMKARQIGLIDTPRQRKTTQTDDAHDGGALWCADNEAFSARFDEARWWKFLVANAHRSATCVFAVAPDVVGDAAPTLDRSLPWLPKIRALGYPAAFVAQNGQEDLPVPWEDFDVLFIGGCVECPEHGPTTGARKTGSGAHLKFFCPVCDVRIYEWKLGPAARGLVAEAKARGMWVHMGRVNSERRYEYARAIGCDSADGTYLTNGADTNLPKLLAWTRNNDQDPLFGGVA